MTMATLTPVDHDPFAEGAQIQGKLTPVDHDPFKPSIDFNRPIEAVRADIAKLPEDQRESALKEWATAFVDKEREGYRQAVEAGGNKLAIDPRTAGTKLNDMVRSVAKGTIIGNFADELNAATSSGLYDLTGGKLGAPYDEAVAYQRALDRAIAKDNPVGAPVAQVTGAVAGPGVVAKKVIGGATNWAGKIWRGAAAGGTAGYVAGLGEGEGDLAQRHEYATSGENGLLGLSPVETGVLAGSTLPAIVSGAAATARTVHDITSPTMARLGQHAQDVWKKIGLPQMSADGSLVNETPAARAAAEQMIANQLARANVSEADLRQSLAQAQQARIMGSNSAAQDALALADLDPSLQRLAGSAGRANPEAANHMQSFLQARQTGVTPRNGLETEAGLPHRPKMSPPITGKEAISKFGHTFGTPLDGEVPMGQGERVLDALKRALQIKDAASHGHASNAYRTEEAIVEAARAEAQPAYAKLYATSQNVNVAPHIDPVLQRWAPDGPLLQNEAEPVKKIVKSMLDLFAPNGKPITSLEKFDRTKQFADGKIAKYFESIEGKDRYVGGLLNNFKNDLLASVDAIKTNGVGSLYKETRGKFSSRMEAREALQRGRDALKEDSDIGADAYRAIEGEANQKLFRLGLYGEAEKRIKSMKRQDDVTRLFDTPRMDQLLQEIIPTSDKAGAVFADRPQRFGGFLGDEKRMIETRDTVRGNSMTQRNAKDDEAYDAMSKLGETVERFKSSATVTMVAIRAMESAMQSLFGMRPDTAASIARQLFTADPIQRAAVLNAVAKRLGANRTEQLVRLMQEYEPHIARAAARQGAIPKSESQ